MSASSTSIHPSRFGALTRGPWPSLLLNAAFPWTTYQILTTQDIDTVPALAATTVFPVVGTLLGWVRLGRPDVLGILSVLFIVLSVTVALTTDNELAVLLRSSVTNAVFAILCFGSLAFGRPLMFYAARQLVAGWDRAAFARFDEQWQQPGFRQTMRRITVAWGCWLTVQSIGRVVAVQLLSVSTFLAAWPIVSIVGTVAMISWSRRYARRGADQGIWNPVEHGAHLSEQAQHALDRAGEEARRFRHRSIGTEHLLISLCDAESAAMQTLRNYGVTSAAARTTLEMSVPTGMASPLQEIGYAPRLQAALRRADDARQATGARQTGPEHLLFGLAADEGGQAASMLAYMGVDLAGLRERLVRFRDLPPGIPPA